MLHSVFAAATFLGVGLALQESYYQNIFVALWLLPALAHCLIKPEKLPGKKGGSRFVH